MKKTSIVVKEKENFEIEILINNTACIKSVTGKTGLLNIETNKIIGKMDNYHTIYDSNCKFYYQEKTIEQPSKNNNGKSKKTVMIYDAQKEKMLIDGWEVVESFIDNYQLSAVRSPIDGKIHLFDRYVCRKDHNIFDMALDDVKLLYEQYNGTYLVVTINGKKGIYCHNGYKRIFSLITLIEFDNIEKFPNIIVYTKNNQKYFICDGMDKKVSVGFDEIILDKNNKNIIYCKKGNRTYVYNIKSQELLNEKCDDIKYLYFEGRDESCGKFYFIITKNNLKGLLETEIIYNNHKAIKTSLLPANYDEIEYSDGVFYQKKDGKTGLFKQCNEQNVFVEADYDKIIDLGYNIYAFYYGDRCDIYKIESKLEQIIKDCKLISSRRTVYYEVEKNGKKGINFYGKDVIPMEYDTIDMKLYNKGFNGGTVYLSLGKKDLGFELAKKSYWNDRDVEFMTFQKFEEINFFEDIMTLRTKASLLIYDYEENLLKKLPVSSQVSMIYRKTDSNHDKKPVYVIDGNFYYYKDGRFEESFVEEIDLYITTYETETDSFEIKTFNKAEHDSFCEIIDSQEDSVAEQSLIDIFENNRNEVRQQHHTLVLKRTIKNN